ncbi:hypothetical protein ABPG75_001969 [Micractinium tetrahymenae]
MARLTARERCLWAAIAALAVLQTGTLLLVATRSLPAGVARIHEEAGERTRRLLQEESAAAVALSTILSLTDNPATGAVVLTLNADLKVGGALTVGGAASLAATSATTLSATGAASLASLSVTGAAKLTSLEVGGSASVGTDKNTLLTIKGPATFLRGATVKGALAADGLQSTGYIKGATLNVDNWANVGGSATIGGKLGVNGAAVFASSATVTGALSSGALKASSAALSGPLAATSATIPSLTVSTQLVAKKLEVQYDSVLGSKWKGTPSTPYNTAVTSYGMGLWPSPDGAAGSNSTLVRYSGVTTKAS